MMYDMIGDGFLMFFGYVVMLSSICYAVCSTIMVILVMKDHFADDMTVCMDSRSVNYHIYRCPPP